MSTLSCRRGSHPLQLRNWIWKNMMIAPSCKRGAPPLQLRGLTLFLYTSHFLFLVRTFLVRCLIELWYKAYEGLGEGHGYLFHITLIQSENETQGILQLLEQHTLNTWSSCGPFMQYEPSTPPIHITSTNTQLYPLYCPWYCSSSVFKLWSQKIISDGPQSFSSMMHVS